MVSKKKKGSGGGRGRGAGRGYGQYEQDGGRGRGKAGGYHSERTGYESKDIELLKQCGYDFQAFTAARDAARKKANELQIPPDGFNQSNPSTESELPEEANRGGENERETSKGRGTSNEPEQGKELMEDAPTDVEQIDGRAVRNSYGQYWKKTIEPNVSVRIAFAGIQRKLENKVPLGEQDFVISSNEASDRAAGVSLAISIAILIAFHRAESTNEKFESDKAFRYLSWFKAEKLFQMVNDFTELDKVTRTIMSHKKGSYSFDPKKINISKLKALHGQEHHKLLEEEKKSPQDTTLLAAIKNVFDRMYPRDAEFMIDRAAKLSTWEKAHLVYMDGSLSGWVEKYCPSDTVPNPPTNYDLSRFSGLTEEAMVVVTDGKYEISEDGTSEENEPQPPNSTEGTGQGQKTKPATDGTLVANLGIDRELFPEMSMKEKRELLMKELPSYILKTAPDKLNALLNLSKLSDEEVAQLAYSSKLQEFLEGSEKNPLSENKSPYSKSKLKYGRDSHGSNEIKTYLIQLKSSTKLNTTTGTTAEAFGSFICFTHGLLSSLGHTVEFIQWKSNSRAEPINRSDQLPVGAELEKYIGTSVVHSKQANKFRSFFFKMRTSYPEMHKLIDQSIEVNGRHEKSFQLFLQSANLIMEVYQSSPGRRQRFLIRETTSNWDPEEVKTEFIARAALKGLSSDPNLYDIAWATCKTEQGTALTTAGLCVFCSIDDDEVVEEVTARLPHVTLADFPVTSKVTLVEAAYRKNTRATVNQYYEQLKYHDDYVKGCVYLTVSGLEDIHPFTFVPTDCSPVVLGSDVADKVIKATLSIGKLLILHKFDLGGEVANSPVRAIHQDTKTGKWKLEAPSKQAGMLGLLESDIVHLLRVLTGKTVEISTEGMTSMADAKMEALRRRRLLHDKNSKSSNETAESTVSESTIDQATKTPPKPPQPTEKPTTIPPTPAQSTAIPNNMIKEITDSLNNLAKLTEVVSNQTSQMEQIKKEIGEIRSTMTNRKPVEEIVISSLSNKVSELTDTTEALRRDVVTVESTAEQIKQVIGTPTGNIEQQIDMYQCVRHIVQVVDSLQYDFETSQKQQEFLVKHSLEIEKDMKLMSEKEGNKEGNEEPNTDNKESIIAEVREAIKPMLANLQRVLNTIPSELRRTLDQHVNSAILRCVIGQGSLRLLLYETMDPADREEKGKLFQGHNHRQLPALTSLSFDEVTRLLHKSPNVQARIDVEGNDCGKCQEVSVPGQMATCTFCDTSYHKLCHDPAFLLRYKDRDYHMCRLCRDDVHLERLILEIKACPSCVAYVKSKKTQLEERAALFDSKERGERENLIRDAVAGNDMWQALFQDIENNLLFVMQRMAPEEDPEEQAPIEAEAAGPANDEVDKVPPPTSPVEERKGVDPPTGTTPAAEPIQAPPADHEPINSNSSVRSRNSDPQTSKSDHSSNEEIDQAENDQEVDEEYDASTESEDSVVRKEAAKRRRTLKPQLTRTYNLRRTRSAPASPTVEESTNDNFRMEGDGNEGEDEGSDSDGGGSIL